MFRLNREPCGGVPVRWSVVAAVAVFAAASATPALAERSWHSSNIFGDGWCYGDVGLGECSVNIYDFDPSEWCRQPREATTSLEFCQDPDNYPRAVMDSEICRPVPDYREHASTTPLSVPPGIQSVLTIVTDASSYSRDDRITFSGITQGTAAREIVSVVIEPPNGFSKIRSGLTSATNTFVLSPIDVADVFGDEGVYMIRAFTNSQGADNAATMGLRHECNRMVLHYADEDPHPMPKSPGLDMRQEAEPGSAPSRAHALAPEREFWAFFLLDPDGILVKDRWCYGTYEHCDDTYAEWWDMTYTPIDGDLARGEHWCFGSLPHCEDNPDIWCRGTRAHCYDQAGHTWGLEHRGPHAYAWPTNITNVISPWEFEWSRVKSVAYDIDAIDNSPPVFVTRPTSETVLVNGGNYTLSLSMDNFVVVDDMDTAPLIDCIVGGIPAIMREVPHEWILETGTHHIQCTALDNEINTSGISYRIVVNTAGDLFPSSDYRRLFEGMMSFYGSPLNYEHMLKIIKHFHSAGILLFDIENANGIVSDPADAICDVNDTDRHLLGKVSWTGTSNTQKLHCLEMLAERGVFSREL